MEKDLEQVDIERGQCGDRWADRKKGFEDRANTIENRMCDGICNLRLFEFCLGNRA